MSAVGNRRPMRRYRPGVDSFMLSVRPSPQLSASVAALSPASSD